MSAFNGLPARACARLLSAAGTDNAANISARRCSLKGIQGFNARGSAVYLKLYDKASAPASTDTPVKTIYLPATSAFALDFSAGFDFVTGLGFRLTTGSADNDTGAVTAADILGLNIDYA